MPGPPALNDEDRVKVGQITMDRDKDVAVVALAGEHDLSTAPELRSQLHAALAEGGLVIDLSACTFLDSSILGVLLGSLRRAREEERGFALVLGKGEPAVRRIFEVTGLTSVFPICDARGPALAKARESS